MQGPIWVTRQPNVKSYYSSHGGHEARGIQWHLSRHMLVVMLLENWVHLLVGVSQQTALSQGSATIRVRHETTDWFKIGKGV